VLGSGAASRFVPGTVLANRYRIVAPVGAGGMGEVYRADDLRLGQTVALKFLPALLSRSEPARARFDHEVSIARQVSHPNVCRVFDIGETEAGPFITMEFVDGEDLGGLLKRIGRLPADKGIEVAQQLCAGLGAAHELGVLHRDLKPANIMLDGRGKVRITDFGLAGVVGQFQKDDLGAGTPAYMAPEQIQQQEVTPQTDIYALGLVLYELFTGKQATAVGSDPKRREPVTPVKPSTAIKGLDPVIERVILKCLQPSPALRPASVMEVASTLPGGDPLRVAIAAGETPSPETVAASGAAVVTSAAAGLGALLLTFLCIAGAVLLLQRVSLVGVSRGGKSPEVLAERAQEITANLGYAATPADQAWWLGRNPEFSGDLASGRGLQFYYRQSQRAMVPQFYMGTIFLDDPAPTEPGMITVILDSRGRLVQFVAVPPKVVKAEGGGTFAWNELLAAAGLDAGRCAAASPAWTPATAYDTRRDCTITEFGETLSVTAGALNGKAVFFRAASLSGDTESSGRTRADQIGASVFVLAVIVVGVGGIFLARRNMRLGRGDRKGALRVAGFIFLAEFLAWVLSAHHVANFDEEYAEFSSGIGVPLYIASFIWVLYMALEPYVRRRWPEFLISSTRVLTGTFRDSRIGRDILFGALGGAVMGAARNLVEALPLWFHSLPLVPSWISTLVLRGPTELVAALLVRSSTSVQWALATVSFVLLARILVRNDRVAILVSIVCLGMVVLPDANLPLAIASGIFSASVAFVLLVRYGMLSVAVALFYFFAVGRWPLTFNFSEWYVWRSIFGLSVLAAIAIYGFYAATAGQALFGDRSLED